MSDSSSRVLSFIQRAKLLTDSAKPISTSNYPPLQGTPSSTSSLKQVPQSLKSDTSRISQTSSTETRIPTPSRGEHKSSSSQSILPTFPFPESTSKSSRQGTPTTLVTLPLTPKTPQSIPCTSKKPDHKSSSSQIFFPFSNSKPPLKGPISRFSSFSKKPPSPKVSSRASTPNASRPSKSPSPSGELFNRVPENSEVLTKVNDPVDLDSAIVELMKIRAGIDEKIKEQQMVELQMIQMISQKLEKVKKSEEIYENIENAQGAYKRKFEKFVEKNKVKLNLMEKELMEIEAQNSEIRAKLKILKVSTSCVWHGRAVIEFDIKTKGEEELNEVLEEQIFFLANELLEKNTSSFKVNWKDLNVALAKKFLIEQSRLNKAEISAATWRREEEKMIDFLEEQIKKAENLDTI